MCCDFFLKYFTEYEVIDDDDYDDINYFDEAINILSKNERGLVIHRTSCGMITFSERFPRWYLWGNYLRKNIIGFMFL